MRDSPGYLFVSTHQKHHNLLSGCSSSRCISSSLLLLIFAPFVAFRPRLREDCNSKFGGPDCGAQVIAHRHAQSTRCFWLLETSTEPRICRSMLRKCQRIFL